ncbi:MAG: carboxypeptidase regulatory-like domain-containing protein, partial [Armatimonadota bacterium]
ITIVEGETTYCNFNLEPVTWLKGQVRDGAAQGPLPGATVDIFKDGLLWQSTSSGSPWGVYEIYLTLHDGLPANDCIVRASKQGYVRQYKWGVDIPLGEATYVNFNLQPSGKLRGQVRDRVTGVPIIYAVVRAYHGGLLWATAMTTPPWGVYEIDSDLPEGTYVVQAIRPGYLPQAKWPVQVSAGSTTYVNFFLQPD